MRDNDVFRFQWNEVELKSRFDPYHCFDGILIVKGDILHDTYWSGGGIWFEKDKVENLGSIEFLCNLDDMKEVDDPDNYEDVVTLRIHAGYRTKHLVRKDAEKSRTKQIEALEGKIEDEQRKIRSAEWSIEFYKQQIKELT